MTNEAREKAFEEFGQRTMNQSATLMDLFNAGWDAAMNQPCQCNTCKAIPEEMQKVRSLSARIGKLENALRFYSLDENWLTRSGKVGITPAWVDVGNHARKALEDK